ncbi:MAG: hypothetical protein GX267_08410 [Fibrobacter sp.]|jgi:spermidine synthase|nr:hypothetical protein [Fibrobacter sp.]
MMMSLFRKKEAQWYSGANGLFSSVAQVIFIREIFAVFSGNEFLLSLALSIWLLFGAAGNRLSRHILPLKLTWLFFLYLLSCVGGILIIRIIPRFVLPGELQSPLFITIVMLISVVPCALLTGALFGVLTNSYKGRLLYRWENVGTIAGLILVSWAVYHTITHLVIILSAALCLLPVLWKNRVAFGLAVLSLLIFVLIEPQSNKWKYGGEDYSVIYGREGEIAIDNERKVVLLNKRIYRMGYPHPSVEQSVHVPLSIRRADRILLIHDNGHSAEIRKYNPSELVCIESEPLLTDSGCICQTPERLSRKKQFDVVILGSDVPENMAMSRLFTEDFFYRIKEMMTDSGLFSFTLSLNSNYLDKYEKKLKDLLIATLQQTFSVVKVFPGEGLTFVASDIPFEFATVCKVPASYFTDFILPSVSHEEIVSANQNTVKAGINKVAHPLILKITLERYLDKFNVSTTVILLLAFVLLIISILFFMRGGTLFSIGTTGFCAGSYTIIVMMIYQSQYGTLYSRVSLLMIALSVGFVIGTYIKKFPIPDIMVGLYVVLSLFFLTMFRNPPEILFYALNSMMGVIGGAQIINCKSVSWVKLNAADLVGGVAGMGLTATLILPGFGLAGAVTVMAIVKAASLITYFCFSRS